MNLPNALTVFRIIMVPMFLYEVLRGDMGIATLIYVGAALTDGLDGFIARVWNQQTELGAYLDPLADKLLVATSFVVLAVKGFVPLWLAVTVISRDVMISLGSLTVYLLRNNLVVKPHPVGKVTTFLQFNYVLLVLLMVSFDLHRGVGKGAFLVALKYPLGVVTGIMTIISGVIYLLSGFRQLEEPAQ